MSKLNHLELPQNRISTSMNARFARTPHPLLKCGAFSHRFFFAPFLFTQLTLHLIRRAFPGSGRATSAQRQ